MYNTGRGPVLPRHIFVEDSFFLPMYVMEGYALCTTCVNCAGTCAGTFSGCMCMGIDPHDRVEEQEMIVVFNCSPLRQVDGGF
jgi:hypothetical protein